MKVKELIALLQEVDNQDATIDFVGNNTKEQDQSPKSNAQIIDDISDAIVYISRNMHHFQGDESDLNDYKEMLRGLSQAINLIKQLKNLLS